MNLHKLKITAVVVTGLMLVVFAALNAYLPLYLKNEYSKTLPLQERVAITEAAITRFNTVDTIDAKAVVGILEADKQAEIYDDTQINLALGLLGYSSNLLIWLLLLHFLALTALLPFGKKS